jgi:hypothetical protein
MTTHPPDFKALLTAVLDEIPCESSTTCLARAAINAPPLAPIPVSERLPGPEDCDDEGRCWQYAVGEDDVGDWLTQQPRSLDNCEFFRITHWLPHWAIPLPEVEE